MATYNTNSFKSGLRIILDKDPYIIIENEFVKPGKGQAFNRVRVKNLKTGKIVKITGKFNSQDMDICEIQNTHKSIFIPGIITRLLI